MTASLVRRARATPAVRGCAQPLPLKFTQDKHRRDPEGSADAITGQHDEHKPARYRQCDGGEYQEQAEEKLEQETPHAVSGVEKNVNTVDPIEVLPAHVWRVVCWSCLPLLSDETLLTHPASVRGATQGP